MICDDLWFMAIDDTYYYCYNLYEYKYEDYPRYYLFAWIKWLRDFMVRCRLQKRDNRETLKPRHTMLDCIYNFLHANFYEIVHEALHGNVHNFINCYARNKGKIVMQKKEP